MTKALLLITSSELVDIRERQQRIKGMFNNGTLEDSMPSRVYIVDCEDASKIEKEIECGGIYVTKEPLTPERVSELTGCSAKYANKAVGLWSKYVSH